MGAPLATPQPTLPSPYAPGAFVPPPPAAPSRGISWVWIVLGVIALLFIAWIFAFCGTCVVAAGS